MIRSTNSLFLQRCLEHAESRPLHQAVVSAAVGLDYTQLTERITGAAAWLQDRGITPGATVGISIADEVEHLVVTLALLALGTRQLALASYESPAARADLARRVGLTHLLHDGRLQHDGGNGPGVGREIPWPGSGAVAGCAPAAAGHPGASVFLRTSGTTSRPNLIEFSEQDLALQAGRNPEYAGDRLLRLASIEHNNSRRHRLYCVWNGGTNVFHDSRRTDLVGFALDKGVTCLYVSRVHAEGLVRLEGARRLRDVRLVVGGSAIPRRTRTALEEAVSHRVFVRYGATETGAATMAGPGGHGEGNDCGWPLPGVEVRITDDQGVDLPSGQAGRIGIRAPGMARGYFDNPGQTAERFREGWFFPGDLGRLEPDGRLVVLGRSDHTIIMNGLNIFPGEIETVLESHPAVASAAAFPLESRIHGQIPVAVVEPAGQGTLEPGELLGWARPRLGLKCPRKIVCVDFLPRNSQGKVLVAELRKLPAFSRTP